MPAQAQTSNMIALLLGLKHQQAGHYHKARRIFARLSEEMPGHDMPLLMLGLCVREEEKVVAEASRNAVARARAQQAGRPVPRFAADTPAEPAPEPVAEAPAPEPVPEPAPAPAPMPAAYAPTTGADLEALLAATTRVPAPEPKAQPAPEPTPEPEPAVAHQPEPEAAPKRGGVMEWYGEAPEPLPLELARRRKGKVHFRTIEGGRKSNAS